MNVISFIDGVETIFLSVSQFFWRRIVAQLIEDVESRNHRRHHTSSSHGSPHHTRSTYSTYSSYDSPRVSSSPSIYHRENTTVSRSSISSPRSDTSRHGSSSPAEKSQGGAGIPRPFMLSDQHAMDMRVIEEYDTILYQLRQIDNQHRRDSRHFVPDRTRENSIEPPMIQATISAILKRLEKFIYPSPEFRQLETRLTRAGVSDNPIETFDFEHNFIPDSFYSSSSSSVSLPISSNNTHSVHYPLPSFTPSSVSSSYSTFPSSSSSSSSLSSSSGERDQDDDEKKSVVLLGQGRHADRDVRGIWILSFARHFTSCLAGLFDIYSCVTMDIADIRTRHHSNLLKAFHHDTEYLKTKFEEYSHSQKNTVQILHERFQQTQINMELERRVFATKTDEYHAHLIKYIRSINDLLGFMMSHWKNIIDFQQRSEFSFPMSHHDHNDDRVDVSSRTPIGFSPATVFPMVISFDDIPIDKLPTVVSSIYLSISHPSSSKSTSSFLSSSSSSSPSPSSSSTSSTSSSSPSSSPSSHVSLTREKKPSRMSAAGAVAVAATRNWVRDMDLILENPSGISIHVEEMNRNQKKIEGWTIEKQSVHHLSNLVHEWKYSYLPLVCFVSWTRYYLLHLSDLHANAGSQLLFHQHQLEGKMDQLRSYMNTTHQRGMVNLVADIKMKQHSSTIRSPGTSHIPTRTSSSSSFSAERPSPDRQHEDVEMHRNTMVHPFPLIMKDGITSALMHPAVMASNLQTQREIVHMAIPHALSLEECERWESQASELSVWVNKCHTMSPVSSFLYRLLQMEKQLHHTQQEEEQRHFHSTLMARKLVQTKLIELCNDQCVLFRTFVNNECTKRRVAEQHKLNQFQVRWKQEEPLLIEYQSHIEAFRAEAEADKSTSAEVLQIGAAMSDIVSTYVRHMDWIHRRFELAHTRRLLNETWDTMKKIEGVCPRHLCDDLRAKRERSKKELMLSSDVASSSYTSYPPSFSFPSSASSSSSMLTYGSHGTTNTNRYIPY